MTRRVSALEATLAVLFVLMTVVSVTLITLMATGKAHTVVFVTADVGMISQRLRLEYTLFMISCKGFMKESIEPLVNGIVKSIDIAHSSIRPGRIFRSRGELEDSSLNRSPHSYLNNPESERHRYTNSQNKVIHYFKYKWNTDKQVLVLKFTDLDGDGIGGGFVAGFSSSNLGDVSPNTKGPHCMNTGLPCDYLNSSLWGVRTWSRHVREHEDHRTQIYMKAKELYGTAVEEVTGVLHLAHQWVNMTDVTVQINATHTGDPFWDRIRDALVGVPSNKTQACHHPKPILFNTGEMNWPLPWHPQIVDVQIITVGSVAVVAVPGEMTTMSGRRLREAVKQELQSEGAFRDLEVVIAGLSNIYTHYITTFEEYQVQRYEGASTIYGPHTLSAYLQKYRGLARAIAQDRVSELPVGPEPPFFTEKLFNLLPAPSIDRKPVNTSFGDVLQQVLPVYRPGMLSPSRNPRNSGDIVRTTSALFIVVTVCFPVLSNLVPVVCRYREIKFVTVEIHDNRTNTWEVVYTDASWENQGSFQRSKATVDWFVPAAAPSGSYRINTSETSKRRRTSSSRTKGRPMSSPSPTAFTTGDVIVCSEGHLTGLWEQLK
ncbi:hypothetical protein F7725_013679 [Dissostichus mawsoni]|uniref:Neutral ceramidase n=1 Tax=Dissostichus mawsoni TaxID=36200 RepID=A0A7J5YVY9_DISMA|nr:hypothetical protein F7725_013679 [Dissostichus mawsoni]